MNSEASARRASTTHFAPASGGSSAASEWLRFWPLPAVAALGYATSSLHFYSIGTYIIPLQQHFGWSRGQISAGLTVAAFGNALFCMPLGRLVDRFGPRRIGIIGVVTMCAAFALLGSATGGTANWIALWAVIAVGSVAVQTTVWSSAVASRFVAGRGLAFAVTLSGAAISTAVFPLLSTWLIGAFGWRLAFVGTAGIWAAVVLPLLILFFRGAQDPQHTRSVVAVNPEIALTGITVREGLRSPALSKLFVATGLFAFTLLGIVVHFVPILREMGATPAVAAGITSLVGLSSLIGRLGTGFLLDRFSGHLVGAIAFLLPMAGCALILLDGTNPVGRTLAAAAVGLTVGSEVDVIAYLAAEHFGLRNFGTLYGTLGMALALGGAFGPLAAGLSFDRYHSYVPFLELAPFVMAIASIALISLGRSKPDLSGHEAARVY